MATTMNVKLLQVTKSASEWSSWQQDHAETVLDKGLLLIETRTDGTTWAKVGDGATAGYTALPYITDGAIASLGQFMVLKGIVSSTSSLPASDNKYGDVWLVGDSSATGENKFTEYVWVKNAGGSGTDGWEELGPIGVSVTAYGAKDNGGLSMTPNATSGVQEFSITNSITAGNTSGTGVTSGTATATDFGGTIEIPYITYDAHGLITAGTGTRSFALPDEEFAIETAASTGGNKGLVPKPLFTDAGKFLGTSGWASLPTLIGTDGTSAGTAGLVPAPDATDNTKFLKGDGDWSISDVTDVEIDGSTIVDGTTHVATIPIMGAASATSDGSVGLVPAPQQGDQGKVLKGDGTWADLSSVGVTSVVANDGTSDTDLVTNGKATIATDGTYNASTNKFATESTVTSAINALDVSTITGFGTDKTLATLTETDGKIAATFQDISIATSNIASTSLNDNTTAGTALDNTSNKLVTERAVANAGYIDGITIDGTKATSFSGIAKSATINGGNTINADSSTGNIALTGLVTGVTVNGTAATVTDGVAAVTAVTGATMNGGNVTVTNGVASLGSVGTAINYTNDSGTTGTITVGSNGTFDLTGLTLQCIL